MRLADLKWEDVDGMPYPSAADEFDLAGLEFADAKDLADDVLRKVDAQLSAFGMEVVLFNTDDAVAWTIQKVDTPS